jgi:hypothetical protein
VKIGSHAKLFALVLITRYAVGLVHTVFLEVDQKTKKAAEPPSNETVPPYWPQHCWTEKQEKGPLSASDPPRHSQKFNLMLSVKLDCMGFRFSVRG